MDCDDSECVPVLPCRIPEDCADGIENDRDGGADCADGECMGIGDRPGPEICGDNVDNDLDGLLDCEDPQCFGLLPCLGLEICGDGIDNNGDQKADCDDPQCLRSGSCLGIEDCDDGGDNDGDGRIDCDDPQCGGVPPCPGPEVCNDRFDNDQDGFLASMVFSLVTRAVLPPPGEWPVVKVRADLDVAGLAPGQTSAPCRLDLRGPGEVGLAGRGPPQISSITVDGQTVLPAVQDLEIVVRVRDPAPFRRGDANDDGKLDISDVLKTLGYLFLGSEAPPCLDSADTDDSGELEITDPLAVFGFLFIGGQSPPAPGPVSCGEDPTPDAIHCAASAGC